MFAAFSIEALQSSIFIGLVITILGMGLTFLALGGIVLGTILLKELITKVESRNPTQSVPQPNRTTELDLNENLVSDEDILAVITASIAAHLDLEQSKFRVVSIQPHKRSGWSHTAKQELTHSQKSPGWR